MFEQYGSDYSNVTLDLNSLLPAVNQSEASYSFLSTLFERWLSKPNLANTAGTIGFSKTPVATAISESTAIRQAYQLYPVFYREQGDEKLVMDWNDILRKLAFQGVDPTQYPTWGTTTTFDFSPPIDYDKFVNYYNYYWVNQVNTVEQPNYVTMSPAINRTNDWSYDITSNVVAGGWMHVNNLGAKLAFAKQAQLPIIEFADIELSRWFQVQRTWKKLDTVLGQYVDTADQPDWAALDYNAPSGSRDIVDINWELQSETLVPIGDTLYNNGVATTLTTRSVGKAFCTFVAFDPVAKTAQYRLATLPQGGTSRQYLLDQNNVILFRAADSAYTTNEYDQIVNFIELESSTLGQYSTDIAVPFSAFVDIPSSPTASYFSSIPLYAHIGAHCDVELTRQLAAKKVKIAPTFTSFTPASGTALGSIQYRDLYIYKLLGQRKLTKSQLPVFNLYSILPSGEYNNQATAGYVVQYTQDASQPVDSMLGQRVSTAASDLSFVTDLVSTTGELLTYKRCDVSITPTVDAHFTVWKNPVTHTPAYVDATRTPLTDTAAPGGWEPSKLLTANPLRETRRQFKYTEVINHFQQLANGTPGTIKIADDGGNHLVSSAIADNLSVPSLVNFITDELYVYRQQFEQLIKQQLFVDTSLAATASSDIPSIVYQALRTAALSKSGANQLYDDTISYDTKTELGYPNFPLTFGTLGLTPVHNIVIESDRVLQHSAIVTHDGSRYSITLSARDITLLETALSSAVLTGATTPSPTVNYSIWQKNSVETYRFECYYFSTSAPTAPVVGRTWYNPATQTASVWNGSQWQGIVSSTLWTEFDVLSLILEVFALQETDISTLIKTRALPLIDVAPNGSSNGQLTQYTAIVEANYTDFAYKYGLQDNNVQIKSRLLSPPSATDPFTWYYGNVPPANINWINIPHWANSTYELYQLLYNTPLPNKQPWMLQGYTTKPTWWDAVYQDVTGTRLWSVQMWSNIQAGIIPYGRQLPDGSVGHGLANQIGGYPVIPVNATTNTIGGYSPDALLPPYVNTQDISNGLDQLLPYTLVPAVTVTTASTILNPTATVGDVLSFSQSYGNGSYTENIWKTNEAMVSRLLIASYQVDPITVVTKLLNRNRKLVGGLLLNANTNNVPKNTDPLHGENGYVDLTLFAALTFFARRNNFSSHNSSPLYAWKSWSTRLAYQTNSLIVPDTLKIYQDCYDVNEYSIVLKKSENIRRIRFSNIIITLDSIGDPTLNTGRGENWTFRLSCSEVDSPVRYRYGILQQSFTWNPNITTFSFSNASDTLRWYNGESLQIVNPPSSIVVNNFYIGTAGGVIRLYTSDTDAISGNNPVDFGTTLPSIVQFRTISATFTAASLNWETVQVDRKTVIPFKFSDQIRVTGVQSLIDFIVSYTEYMQDDGITVNAGDTPATDPDTNEVISWQQQITKAVNRIFASNGLTAYGYNPVFVPDVNGNMRPITADRISVSTPFAEINPFRTAVYFQTPDGVICNLQHVPYANEYNSIAAIYDDTGAAISASELVPLRTDRITTVIFNNAQPPRPVNVNQDISRRIAFGEISLDFYEHVIVFDQQTANGLTIFDRFFDLQKTFLNLEFQKSIDFFYRPVMGGFSVTQHGVTPNFEMVAGYQRNNYNVANSNELIRSTIDSRQMLGKLPLSYFQNIPVTSKTEFQFWQQMIREKGTKSAVDAFTRHALYESVNYDEFWAWKLGTFGSVEVRNQLEMLLTPNDALQLANTFWLSDKPLPYTPYSNFNISTITPLDQSRWIDFPNYLDSVGQGGIIFGQNSVNSIVFSKTRSTSTLHFSMRGDSFSVEYYDNVSTSPTYQTFVPMTSASFVIVNNNTIQLTDTTYDGIDVRVVGYLAAYNEFSPIRVIDAATKIVTNTLPAWDPANGIHTASIAQFDYNQSTDPALYSNTLLGAHLAPWGSDQVGSYWLDNSQLVYKPYSDSYIFPSLDDRVQTWGELADGYQVTGYQWVQSTVAPTIQSVDLPYVRHVLYTRVPTYVTISGSQFTVVSNPTTPTIPPHSLPFVTNDNVVLYKNDPNATTPVLDTILGIQYSIQNINGNTFTLIGDGVMVTLPPGSESAELFITKVWGDVTPTELTPLVAPTMYACDNAGSNVFQLPWTNNAEQPNFVQQDLTSSAAIVTVNGSAVPFSITNTGAVSLLDSTGNPRVMHPTDIINVSYPTQAIAATGVPAISSSQLTYVDTDVPYVSYTQLINQRDVTSYYYWAANPNIVNNPVKTMPLTAALADITYPLSGNFMVSHATWISDAHNASQMSRQLITTWGLYGTHRLDTKALAIDIDKTMRDKFFESKSTKPTNEQWVLFREYQDGLPNTQIWEAVVATVVGMRNVNTATSFIVPTPDRMSYDYLYGTTLSYGTSQTQTLISPTRAQELFLQFFSVDNPLVDSSLHVLFSQPDWVALLQSGRFDLAMQFVYKNLPSNLLNSFIFVILREGLYNGYHYDRIFKTSYVALQTSQKVVVG